MDPWITSILETMCRYIGQTVTIFTTSGGISGSGFTGVLLSADCNSVRLLTDIGEYPACPVGSACTGPMTPWGMPNYGYSGGYGACGSPLGSICVIPTCAIACFTHNAI